ncbi:MAG: hypothetical protein Q9221_000750 [Calogaya cf. arnoldii]
MTPTPPASISRRKHYRTVPGDPSEPTSTLVLTSPRGFYVDIRVFKEQQPSSDPKTFDGKLQWAFAGTKTSEQTDGRTISTWFHPIDSLSDDPPPDKGEMLELDSGYVLEKGESVDAKTGERTEYEELWEELLSTFSKTQDSWRRCVVLKTVEEEGVKGMAIKCGSYCQGILKNKGAVTVERWEFVRGERAGWHERTVRFGEGVLPCERLVQEGLVDEKLPREGCIYWDLAEKKEGDRVTVGGVEWVVEEVARW